MMFGFVMNRLDARTVHIPATIVAVTTTTAAACGHDFGRTEERVKQLEGRADKQDGELKELRDLATSVDKSLSNIQGWRRWARRTDHRRPRRVEVSGAVIGALVSAGASLAIGLASFLLKGGQ
jgi:hypothetical protein